MLTVFVNSSGSFSGKIISASGQLLILETQSGWQALQKSAVWRIESSDGFNWKLTTTATSKAYRIKTDSPQDGKLYLVGLERGLTWAPAYLADISDPKKLTLTSKATILDDLGNLDGIDVRLITGFPNVPFAGVLDPFTLTQTLDEFTAALMNLGTPNNYRQAPGAMMQQNAAYGRMNESFDQAFNTPGFTGFQSEDLFFYNLPKVTLQKGERGYYVLFTFESPYEHLYEWDVADQITPEEQYRPQPREEQPEEVWHSLKFQNTGKQPLTTAAAVTMKDGEILGQDLLKYTSVSCDTTLKITKAMDVIAEQAEQEAGRERKTLPWGGSTNYPFDEVTLKGTLRVRNLKPETIKISITKELTGEVLSKDGAPEITSLAKGLRSINPRQRLKWVITVKPGEKREIAYSYKVLLRV